MEEKTPMVADVAITLPFFTFSTSRTGDFTMGRGLARGLASDEEESGSSASGSDTWREEGPSNLAAMVNEDEDDEDEEEEEEDASSTTRGCPLSSGTSSNVTRDASTSAANVLFFGTNSYLVTAAISLFLFLFLFLSPDKNKKLSLKHQMTSIFYINRYFT
jgi:hypothetical protein